MNHGMTDEELQFYNGLLDTYGNCVQGVGWKTKQSQTQRFCVLSEIGKMDNRSVLDFGCGLGDLCHDLKGYGSYTGYDQNPRMVKLARGNYPGVKFTSTLQGIYDYVMVSGAFNLRRPGWLKHVHDTLALLMELCRIGVAVNFLSALAKTADSRCFYADPGLVAGLAASLTSRFTLRHDYRENDFTVYLYKP